MNELNVNCIPARGITMEFDGGPVPLANGRRIIQHGQEQIAHALQFDFAPPPKSGLGDQRVEAAAIVKFDPQTQHPVSAGAEFTDLFAGVPQQQGAQRLKPDEAAAMGRGLHRHAQFRWRGVLRVRLNFGRSQPS